MTTEKKESEQKSDIILNYKLPEKVQFCKSCVISNQRPRITFNGDGICNACEWAATKKSINWEEREKELRRLLDRFRKDDGSHDVIVPCSGGKDSSWVAYNLKEKYGMNPLTVTWAPHCYTEIGWKNFQNFIHSGFDNILGTPNGKVHRHLTRLALEIVGDPFQPFITGVKSFPIRIAVQLKIPLIFYGENADAEYGGDKSRQNNATHDLDRELEELYFRKFGPAKWSEYGVDSKLTRYYELPPREETARIGVQCHYFGYYHPWIPQQNYYHAVENTGFEANPDGRSEGTYSKYASLDDQLDGFHYYLMYLKFGIGRCTSDAAHEVRDGHLTRDEAVELVRRYDGEYPTKYEQVFLDYCEITKEELENIFDKFRSPHLWKKVSGKWHLRHTVWGGGTDD